VAQAMISYPRNSLSVISYTVVLTNALCHDEDFAVLFEVSDDKSELYEDVIRNTLQKSCRFVIIAGEYCEDFKESLLDYLVEKEKLIIPFFVFDTFAEALDVFLFGDLPIDNDYDCIFISLSDCTTAIESGRMIFNAASR
jgi:hypothetical protein